MESTDPQQSTLTQMIPVNKIVPSPYQARKVFDEAELKELAESMRDRSQLVPICVRPVGEMYELIAGERRWRAAQMNNSETIEAKVVVVDDKEAALRGLVENLQRRDLNAMERARGYKLLADPPFELSFDEIAKADGTADRQTVSRYIGLLDLPAEVQDLVSQDTISEAQIRYLKRLNDPDQFLRLTRQAAQEGWNVRETERQVKQLLNKEGSQKPDKRSEPATPIPPDPLAQMWPFIQMELYDAKKPWGVTHGFHKVSKDEAASLPTWFFWVTHQGKTPIADLKRWLIKLAESLGDTEEEQARQQDIADIWRPQTESESQQMFKENDNVRVPQAPEEEDELERLAAQGPGPVYAWLFDAGGYYAKKSKGLSWQDLGMADEKEGLKKVLEMARALKAFDPEAFNKAMIAGISKL